MAKSPEERNHQEWLGYVQPVGLVVSTPAMLAAQCHINKNIGAEHQRLLGSLPRDNNEIVPEIQSLRTFVTEVLGWRDEDLRIVPIDSLPEEFTGMEVVLPEYGEVLRPTYVVPAFRPDEKEKPWMMLVKEVTPGHPLDDVEETDSRRWHTSPHAKFERLLRETEIPIGLLSNGKTLRLVYAPRGETSGYMTFDVEQMTSVAGRPIFAAMYMLLCEERLFSLEKKQLLPTILAESRKYQSAVSTQLAHQVMAALFEMLRGFQSADDQRKGELLEQVLQEDPQQVYHGLLTTLMRMVFILYAEDRGLLSTDSVYTNHYSISGLYERLREDAGRFPDTMDQRYGAWAGLLTLFRIIYEGGNHGEFQIPPRKGYLFDPDRYPFLEGRTEAQSDDGPLLPRISDGVVYRVLEDLLILDGERLSYRTLDVEQIGSVYEAVMGFELEVAYGRSIAIKPTKSHGAPATINLEALLDIKPGDRAKRLKEWTDHKIAGATLKELKAADSIEGLLAALQKKIAKHVTPNVVPAGAMVFQPSDERRRSGSHYTPRSLTEPIVRTTLEPILKQLCDPESAPPEIYEPSREDKQRYTKGELAARIQQSEQSVEYARLAREIGTPHPAQILDLKICDPAMGSGAFLVETCRQLGDELIKAWAAHALVPSNVPPDEDEVLYARRLVAQRCLYGVDKNDMAVDLAKLSLWLVTLAKDHPFTFLDHSLRHGDSLVGLTRRQIIGFHWEPKKQQQFGEDLIQRRLDRATEARAKILNAREDVPYRDQEQRLAVADEALNVVRLTGDACVSTFFAGSKKKEREDRCEELFASVSDWYASGHDISKRGPIAAAAACLRSGEHPIPPFHWEIEFPEVFSRENGGFDGFVGNPPFAGKNTLIAGNRSGYVDWLKAIHDESHGSSDLVAHFFRHTFGNIRRGGTLGLIATNTVAQGDTRSTGLRWICQHDGAIYCARRRYGWPGLAAVIVSVVHIHRGEYTGIRRLDGREVDIITAYLFHMGGHENPSTLTANQGLGFQGPQLGSLGFLLDTDDALLPEFADIDDPRNGRATLVKPYFGGEDLNAKAIPIAPRFVIDTDGLKPNQMRAIPSVHKFLLDRVRPDFIDKGVAVEEDEEWWNFRRPCMPIREVWAAYDQFLCVARVSRTCAFTFLPRYSVANEKIVVFNFGDYSSFCLMQSRVHEVWARLFSATMKDDLQYALTDCLETFPFPRSHCENHQMCSAGDTYFEKRRVAMVENDEGLTATYNRFHDPHEQSSEILHLRELHAAMDRAVLEAYGWDDLAQSATCEFLLDYEEDEDETGRKSKKKKPWRLRWPDEFRDEVLARLLELNEKRHKEEQLAGKLAEQQEKQRARAGKRNTSDPRQEGLFS